MKLQKRLELYPMVGPNASTHETAFTVSVDDANAATELVQLERDNTIKILASPISKAVRVGSSWTYFSTNCKRWWCSG